MTEWTSCGIQRLIGRTLSKGSAGSPWLSVRPSCERADLPLVLWTPNPVDVCVFIAHSFVVRSGAVHHACLRRTAYVGSAAATAFTTAAIRTASCTISFVPPFSRTAFSWERTQL